MKISHFITIVALSVFISSCASYVTPGGPADLSTFTEPSLKKSYSARAAAHFPAHLITVRVQDSGYSSYSSKSYGKGKYSVVTTRDVETEKDLEKLSKLNGVAQVGVINRLLLPNSLGSDLDIRKAAAKLHGDIILLYTLDTSFTDQDLLSPLTTVTLGLAPTTKYKVTATAAALLMDARTGFVYGVLEESADSKGLTISWGSRDTIDAARRKVEREAFEKMLTSFEPFWARVYRQHR